MVKQITGDRLDIYAGTSDIDFILEKRYANNINDALLVPDIYVTLAQCAEIERNDIQMKVSDAIEK